ncbi:MAG: type II secretion system F family protein [Candidatus Riflebacteria bacterium]|nr:type II secretion system F family protein [Candidatus Riflebacteria bacterium]
MTFIPAIKILAILGVIIGIYFVLEEQLDINFDPSKAGKDKDGSGRSRYLQGVTGANLEDQLIEVLLMVSSCLKAGRNLDQAFELVAVSTPPPICNEFRTLVQERRLGVSMVEALTNLATRVPSADLRLAINATIFQQETGGNLEDLYRQIVLTVAERKKIMGKVIAGTAHARLSGNLVGSMPIALAAVITAFHPQYLVPMLENPVGQAVLIVTISAAIIGLMFINRMTSSILPEAEEAVIAKNDARAKGQARWPVIRAFLSPLTAFNKSISGEYFKRLRLEVKFLLEASNKAIEFSADEYLSVMEVSTIVFLAIVILFVDPFSFGLYGWLILIVLSPIGFRLPRIYLGHLIKKRQKNIEFDLPYVIDLLSLAIESGLDLTGGIAKVVEKSRNTDIIVEFKMFLSDTKVGKSLEEALADMAERVRVLSFFSFVSSLIQAQRLGAEIGPTLRAQAEQMRYQRMIMAEERVNKLPVKLLIPLVFFIFPSISVLLIGPAALQMQKSMPGVMMAGRAKPHGSALKKGVSTGADLSKSIILRDNSKAGKKNLPAPVSEKPKSVLITGESIVVPIVLPKQETPGIIIEPGAIVPLGVASGSQIVGPDN